MSRPQRRALWASQNNKTAVSFSSFWKGGSELQVPCSVGCASCTKSLAALALKCQNQDNVAPRQHVGLCGSRRGWTATKLSRSLRGKLRDLSLPLKITLPDIH